MAWDPVWEQVYRERAWGRYPGEDVVRFAMGHYGRAAPRAGVRMLEVGCGTGANLWFLAREGFSVTGLDRSDTAVRLCGERLDAECPGWRQAGGEVRTGDLLRLPDPDASFDAVIDVVAICYSGFDEAAQAYRELARVTKPGGRLFSRTFARGCWGEGTGEPAGRGMWACGEGPLKGYGATRFTAREEVPALIDGWDVERIEESAHTEADGAHWIRHLLIHGVKR
ncbi:class I SAM-dependent methyltransferase [Ramlibacter humi]|nr:class I SAM-dependent methyltransferase [Ramlibacter humi]